MHTINSENIKGLNLLGLRIIAMVAMLSDHVWITIVDGNNWLTYLGRLAFPLFAFLLVEGFYHTSNRAKYLGRLFLFAIISEVPFNLMHNGTISYSLHQNVVWTLIVGLLVMMSIEVFKKKIDNVVVTGVVTVMMTYAGYYIASNTLIDYLGFGILTIVLFYTCHNLRYAWIGQLAGLIYINAVMMHSTTIPLTLFDATYEFPVQAFAVFSLLIIWKYNGTRGRYNNVLQYGSYFFYPVHMTILGLLALNNFQITF